MAFENNGLVVKGKSKLKTKLRKKKCNEHLILRNDVTELKAK